MQLPLSMQKCLFKFFRLLHNNCGIFFLNSMQGFDHFLKFAFGRSSDGSSYSRLREMCRFDYFRFTLNTEAIVGVCVLKLYGDADITGNKLIDSIPIFSIRNKDLIKSL